MIMVPVNLIRQQSCLEMKQLNDSIIWDTIKCRQSVYDPVPLPQRVFVCSSNHMTGFFSNWNEGSKTLKVCIRSYSSGNSKFSYMKTGQYKWLRIKMLQKLFHYFMFTGINTKSKIFVVNNSYRIWNFLSLSSIKMLIEHLLSEQILPTRNILCFCWQSRFEFLRL